MRFRGCGLCLRSFTARKLLPLWFGRLVARLARSATPRSKTQTPKPTSPHGSRIPIDPLYASAPEGLKGQENISTLDKHTTTPVPAMSESDSHHVCVYIYIYTYTHVDTYPTHTHTHMACTYVVNIWFIYQAKTTVIAMLQLQAKGREWLLLRRECQGEQS